jgi:hypothetical protein
MCKDKIKISTLMELIDVLKGAYKANLMEHHPQKRKQLTIITWKELTFKRLYYLTLEKLLR